MQSSVQETPSTEPATAKGTKPRRLTPNPEKILKLYEATTGTRYCTICQNMMPLGDFPRAKKCNPRHFRCKIHLAPRGRPVKYKDPEARLRQNAALSMKARARDDRIIFGHSIVDLTMEETQELLTEEHVNNFADYAIIPLRPTEILSKQNVAVVSFDHRKYLTAMWRVNRDPVAYQRDMATLLEERGR